MSQTQNDIQNSFSGLLFNPSNPAASIPQWVSNDIFESNNLSYMVLKIEGMVSSSKSKLEDIESTLFSIAQCKQNDTFESSDLSCMRHVVSSMKSIVENMAVVASKVEYLRSGQQLKMGDMNTQNSGKLEAQTSTM